MMACPAHTKWGRYATLIAEGRFEEAYRFARDSNPLASICRRVCGATWYLGAMTFGTFMIIVISRVQLMLYRYPSVLLSLGAAGYADTKDCNTSCRRACSCATCVAGQCMPWCSWCSLHT
jgi:hypothetical protein